MQVKLKMQDTLINHKRDVLVQHKVQSAADLEVLEKRKVISATTLPPRPALRQDTDVPRAIWIWTLSLILKFNPESSSNCCNNSNLGTESNHHHRNKFLIVSRISWTTWAC